MHKHLLYSPLKFKGIMDFKHLTVMMKAGRKQYICSTYELFTQEKTFQSLENESLLWYMTVLLSLVCMGIVHYVLLPLELFTNALAGRGRPESSFSHQCQECH